MIYIKRNLSLIPSNVLKAAERAQKALEVLPETSRKEYIENRSKLWGAFKPYLAQMSNGKCWYSESKDPQSFFDVDHYRPKKEAKRSDTLTDEGYPWLAFSWKNFRFATARSNRLNTDEESELVVGKGSWFPLCSGSAIADWNNRCVDKEIPMILDPTIKEDVRLIEVSATGKMQPSRYCIGTKNKERVRVTIKYLGLDLPALLGARMQAMRDIELIAEEVLTKVTLGAGEDAAANLIAESLPIGKMLDSLKDKTRSSTAYAAAIRAQLTFMGLGDLCVRDEEVETS